MRLAVAALGLERHRTERIGWLRAAVLGANDGIVSTASLLLGVAGRAGHIRCVVGREGAIAGAAQDTFFMPS